MLLVAVVDKDKASCRSVSVWQSEREFSGHRGVFLGSESDPPGQSHVRFVLACGLQGFSSQFQNDMHVPSGILLPSLICGDDGHYESPTCY